MSSKYKIMFNHRSSMTADSKKAAEQLVANEMRQPRMFRVKVDDGEYFYRSKADADRDADGSRAFAVINAE